MKNSGRSGSISPRNPALGPLNWAHHEKLVVCDEEIAFISGMDLSIGRWDLHGRFPLFDDGPEGERTWIGNDYWNQFNVKPRMNIITESVVQAKVFNCTKIARFCVHYSMCT